MDTSRALDVAMAITDNRRYYLGRIDGGPAACDRLDGELRALGFSATWLETDPPQLVIRRGYTLPESKPTREVRLENVVKALLLFYSGGAWDDTMRQRWLALGLGEECTSKALCDAARAALGEE